MMHKLILNNLLKVLDTLYPNVCPGCTGVVNSSDSLICTKCELSLPVSYYFNEKENPLSKIFWGKIDFEYASSFLLFNKRGITQSLMHNLKYGNRPEIGEYLGKRFANELLKNNFYKTVDAIVPLPLHERRERIRGYNQSDFIAKGIGDVLNIPVYYNSVIRSVNTISQTKVSAQNRFKNVENIFKLTEEHQLNGKHILIIDDTITTGSTMISIGKLILEETDCKISFASLASVV